MAKQKLSLLYKSFLKNFEPSGSQKYDAFRFDANILCHEPS